ncbi:MAG TPA: hypothetical protein PKM25_17895, partial [Candidatus Ozemobacteraceae bacterium]|nr:hypothetical protein [Candidatus Ozemobacteraceae bacterium]
ISKIKFYIVMNDVDGAAMRISQLIGVIRSVLGAETGSIPAYGSYGNSKQLGTELPTRPLEVPVGGGQIGGSTGVGGIGLPSTN